MKLGAMLAGSAARFPGREALVCDGRRLTFRDLDEIANRIANGLAARGLRPGDRIAMYMPNSAELILAMLGAAKCGGVIVPIATRLAPAEVDYILEDCAPSAILFPPEYRDAATAAARRDDPLLIVAGAARDGEIAYDDLVAGGDPSPPPPVPTDMDDLLIGYTSGTTGRPKGAVTTHLGFVLVGAFVNVREFGLESDDRILTTTPMAHRTGVGRITNAIAAGCAVVVMPRFDPVACVDMIERERITVIGLVPTIARMLIPEIEKRPDACRTLRVMVATGEVFPVELKERLAAALPGLGLYSFYAQTEAGFVACLRPDEQQARPTSCGRAVPGVEIRIVDGGRNDLPAGETGEILVRCGPPGTMTMREYWRNPEATAAAFHDGWLITGDLGRLDEEGYLYFADRAKDMIVSGGLNIYSREVEDALERHPAVREAAVVPAPDPEFGECVVAFVRFEDRMSAAEDALIAHCRSLIAGYKKPKHVLAVDGFPRNSTGKIVKAELRARAAAELKASDGTAAFG